MSERRNNIKIKVSKGNEYRTSVMDVYNKEDFFYESFQLAAANITEIVVRSTRSTRHCSDNYRMGLATYSLSNYPNNIISFCAERGQGKTSAMLSMSEALKKINIRDDEQDSKVVSFWNRKEVIGEYDTGRDNPVLNTRFEVLDPIDPTMMEKNDSIIKNVISKMFKTASEKWDNTVKTNIDSNCDHLSNYSLRDDLLKEFVKCFRSVDRLYNDNVDSLSSYDDLNMLAEYGDSDSFKTSLNKLVNLYLKFTSFGKSNSAMLVIQIDDADLNIKNAHAISEEIRKYFVMPNVVVMMALNTGTLSRTLEQYFLSQYKDYARYGDRKLIRKKCHDIMEKYIEKLIPSAHRIYIPKVDDFICDNFNNISLEYVDGTKDNPEEHMRDTIVIYDSLVNPDMMSKKHRYQEKLIMMIYQKTGIILIKPDYSLHDFLPHNMRMLNHFMIFLSELDDVITDDISTQKGSMDYIFEKCLRHFTRGKTSSSDNRELISEVDRRLYNLRKFYDYYRHSWCTMYLDNSQLEIIEMICKTSRNMKLKRTRELLNKYRNDHQNNIKSINSSIPVESLYADDDISFSEIVLLIYDLKKLSDYQEQISFICALNMYFTIYLHTLAMEGLRSWLSDPSKMATRSPFCDLISLIGYSIFPLKDYQKKSIIKLEFKKENLIANRYSRSLNNFYYHFLCAVREDLGPNDRYNYRESAISIGHSDGKVKLNSDSYYFDVFRPLFTILDEEDFYNDYFRVPSLRKYRRYHILSSALNIMCNMDIQILLHERFFSLPHYEDSETTKEEKELFDRISGMYSEMDAIISNNSVVRIDSSVAGIFNKMIESELFECIQYGTEVLVATPSDQSPKMSSELSKKEIVFKQLSSIFIEQSYRSFRGLIDFELAEHLGVFEEKQESFPIIIDQDAAGQDDLETQDELDPPDISEGLEKFENEQKPEDTED